MLKLTSTEPHRIVTETLIIPVCQDKDIHHSPVIRTLVRQALGIDTFRAIKTKICRFTSRRTSRPNVFCSSALARMPN